MAPSPDFKLFTSLRYDPLLATLPINTESWETAPSPSSPFYILPYHRDRMLQAAEHFGWTIAAERIRGPEGFAFLLKQLNKAIGPQSTTPLRVRTVLSHDGTLLVETSPAAEVTQWNLFPTRLPPPTGAGEPNVSSLTGGLCTIGDGESIHGDPPTQNPWDVLVDTVKTQPSSYTSYKTTSRDMYNDARVHVEIKDFAEKREVLIISEKEGEIMEGSLTSVYFWRDGRWVTPAVRSGGNIGTTRRWALEKG